MTFVSACDTLYGKRREKMGWEMLRHKVDSAHDIDVSR